MADTGQRLISGAGGSTSQSLKRAQAKAKPKIQDESIGSLQFFELLDLWCEGEIEGFASGAKSGYARDTNEYNRACLKDIYLDGTPILSPTADVEDQPSDSDFNFADAVARFRWGTQVQSVIPNFAGVQSEISVGVIVRQIAPVTRRVTDTNVDAVRVSLTWQQAQEFMPDGSIEGVTVEWQIQLSYNGGPFTVASADTIQNERSADPFTLDRTVDLNGAFPVDVRVVRTSADTSNPQRFDEFSWSSYTERQYIRMRYPNSAYCYLKLDSRGFTSVPVRSYRLRLQKIRIPSNGTVDQSNGRISYSGIWDGTFTAAQWCSDPAWALYDLLTSTRYGLGEHIPADALDKWAFYSASVYCNELV
jgi:predicted phage tail protein